LLIVAHLFNHHVGFFCRCELASKSQAICANR
jgi:hypothetical protein